MNIQLTITGESPTDFLAGLQGVFGVLGGAAPAIEMPKKEVKKKDKDEAPASSSVGSEFADNGTDGGNITAESLRALYAAKKDAKKATTKDMKAILDELGAESITALPKDKYASCKAKLDAL